MRRSSGLALFALLSALPTGAYPGTEPAAPTTQVKVDLPPTDALAYAGAGSDRAALLADLARDLERAVRPRLPAGSTLKIALLTVDLAGRFEPWHGPQLAGVRIVRNVYSPRIELEFSLADAAGSITRQGRRRLQDPSGALLGQPDLPADPLRYEKRLLRDWVDREFADAVRR